VGFRYSTQREAKRLGVTGWVRNRREGTVEICAQGDDASLQTFLAWCRKGPAHAGVNRIDEFWGKPQQTFTDFTITETA
jgi:acylphosphatase